MNKDYLDSFGQKFDRAFIIRLLMYEKLPNIKTKISRITFIESLSIFLFMSLYLPITLFLYVSLFHFILLLVSLTLTLSLSFIPPTHIHSTYDIFIKPYMSATYNI